MPQRGRSPGTPGTPPDHDAAGSPDPGDEAFDLDAPGPPPRRTRTGASATSRTAGPVARGAVGRAGAPTGAADPGPGGGRHRSGAAPARSRGPAALVALALVAALAGGAWATHHQRGALERAVAVERVLGAVDVADPVVAAAARDVRGIAAVADDGRTGLRLGLTVTNTSDTPAAVTITAVEVGGGGTPVAVLEPGGPQQLAPLGTGVVVLDAAVDCSAVPAPGVAPSAATDWVRAAVVVGGEERVVRWGHRSARDALASQLADVCHGPPDLSSAAAEEDPAEDAPPAAGADDHDVWTTAG